MSELGLFTDVPQARRAEDRRRDPHPRGLHLAGPGPVRDRDEPGNNPRDRVGGAVRVPHAHASRTVAGRHRGQPRRDDAPARPAALDGPATEDNAKAVGRYFLSLFPYVVATGDLTAWDALSGQSCTCCSSVREFVTEIHDAGHHGEGGAFELGFTSGFDVGGGDFVVGIEYIETPSQTVAADGTVVEDFPENLSYKANFSLTWTGTTWVVNGVQVDDWGKNS